MELLKIINFFLLVAHVGPSIQEGDFPVHEILFELVFDEELVVETGDLVLAEVLSELELEILHLLFEFRLVFLQEQLFLQLALLLDLPLQLRAVPIFIVKPYDCKNYDYSAQDEYRVHNYQRNYFCFDTYQVDEVDHN